jgi:hypothetical protein
MSKMLKNEKIDFSVGFIGLHYIYKIQIFILKYCLGYRYLNIINLKKINLRTMLVKPGALLVSEMRPVRHESQTR